MPSTKVLGALVLALAARPSNSFLPVPWTPGAAASRASRDARHGGPHTETVSPQAFRSRRYPRASNARVLISGGNSGRARGGRNTANGALMMAKKKAGGGKKKGVVGKKQAVNRSAAAGTGTTGGGGVATAETESRSDASAAAPIFTSTAVADKTPESTPANTGNKSDVIQNRVANAEPVSVPTRESLASPPPKSAGSGFGALVAQPKAPRKQDRPTPAQPARPPPAALPVAAQAGGFGGTRPIGGLPPKLAGPAQDALAPGLVVEGNTDHQLVIETPDKGGVVTEANFADEVLGDAFDSIKVETPDGRKMTAVEMLKYLRDNNISIDLETMNPVEMKTKAAEKVAAMFPYPSASLMAKRSLGSRPTPSAYVNAMLDLLPKDEPWNPAKIRQLPELKEFLLANRLHGGNRGMNVVSSFLLKAMGQGDLEKAKMLKGVGICVTKAENALTGPFRQAVMFAENRLAPFMGSTVCEDFAGEDGADAAATWVVLKACVAEWELRLREIRQEEVGLHDIFRAIPNPTEGLDEERTASITGSVQAMGLAFSSNEKILRSLPPEIRFMEGSLGLNTTTEVRRFALQEFCPKEVMSPEELRLRIRSMLCSMDQLPRKSYHQLQVAIGDVYDCLVEGTPEEYNIYTDNWGQGENLSFDTYRVDTDEKWRLKLREYVTNTGYGSKQRKQEDSNYDSLIKEILPKGLWGLANMAGDESETEQDPFVMVKEGWLDSLDYLDEGLMQSRTRREAMGVIKPEPRKMDDLSEDEEIDDIFTDFMVEEEKKMKEFGMDTLVLGEIDPDIRDGPGEGMEELDLGFDLPEGIDISGFNFDEAEEE